MIVGVGKKKDCGITGPVFSKIQREAVLVETREFSGTLSDLLGMITLGGSAIKVSPLNK